MATATKKKATKRSGKRKSAAKPSEADVVRATAANPSASLVGTEDVLQSADSPLKVRVIDGARATLELAKHDPLTQAELHATAKLIAGAIQETY